MTIYSFLLGFILSSLLGSLFHLVRNGGIIHYIFYIILSWLGFWGGHLFASNLHWEFGSIGPLHVFPGLILNSLVLLIGDWLSKFSTS